MMLSCWSVACLVCGRVGGCVWWAGGCRAGLVTFGGWPSVTAGHLLDRSFVDAGLVSGTGWCSTCPHRSVRGRFLIGRVRSLRESPRAAVPTVAVTGEGKDRWATNRKLLPMPRQNDIPGWVAVPGWQGPAVERRQAAATDNPMVD